MTVSQCKHIVEIQNKLDILMSLLGPKCPKEAEKHIKNTIWLVEKERDRLLIKYSKS